MKNRTELIHDASEVIAKHVESHEKGFDLFYGPDGFYCSETCPASEMLYFLRHFSAGQAAAGLTGPQWLRIGKKAVKLDKESAE